MALRIKKGSALDLPELLEQVASNFDSVRDLVTFASTCRAAWKVVCSREWPSVKNVQLLHSVPKTRVLRNWVKRCSCINEVEAENCVQLSNELLLTLSDLPIKVLKLNGCWRLGGIEAQSAVTKIAEAGFLEVLGVRDTSIDINTELMKTLSISPNLRELCAPTLQGDQHEFPEAVGTNMLWPALEYMQFTTADLEFNTIKPKKLDSLLLGDCPLSHAVSTLFLPPLRVLTINRANIDVDKLNYLGAWCPYLEYLDLSGCSIGDNELNAMKNGKAAASGRLKQFILRDLHQPSSQAFNRLLTSLANPLSAMKRTGGDQLSGFTLDLTGCANVDDESFAGYAERFKQWRSKGLPVHHIEQLRLSFCWLISHALLSQLANIGCLDKLQVLHLYNVVNLSADSKEPEDLAQITQALCTVVSAAGRNLVDLDLDEAAVTDELLAAVARWCNRLRSLSIIECNPFTDAGLQSLAQGCPLLKSLSVGGPSSSWRECCGLAAFKGLQELTIWPPSCWCTDSSLIMVLEQHPQLERFKLGMCNEVTDEAIKALPANSLRELTLDSCKPVRGHSIARLTRLEALRLPSCDCIAEVAVQAIALACKRLRMLELPSNIPTAIVPVASYDHLRGLRIEGGAEAQK